MATVRIASALRNAADQITKYGWWVPASKRKPEQGYTRGSFCALLALGNNTDAIVYFAHHLGCESEKYGDCATYTATWNDVQPNAQTVINKLIEAANAAA